MWRLVAYLSQLDLLIPRSVILLSPVLTLLAVGGTRALYRALRESRTGGGSGGQRKRLFVLGTGDAGAALAARTGTSGQWQVVGAFDDRRDVHGREIHGVPVLGSLGDVERLAREMDVREAIIAMPDAAIERRQEAATVCLRAGLNALLMPALSDLIEGRVTIENVRRINLEDLLGREAVRINSAEVGQMLGGAVVMVTGAGGSIGSELCRQIARFAPSRLVLFEHSEFALYRITEEFSELFPEIPYVGLVGDVQGRRARARGDPAQRPAIVFHAAAYKHVPLMERDNAWQAVRTTCLAPTWSPQTAIDRRVPRFVLVSTDKAVNPTNVMGATKRLAEIVCQALQPRGRLDADQRGALRQRARQRWQRDPEVPGAGRARRPGHGHASGRNALLHVDPGGVATGAAGRRARRRRADLRARDGAAGAHPRRGAHGDPAVRAQRRGDRDPFHRHAPRRKTARRGVRQRRADRPHQPSERAGCQSAPGAGRCIR